MNGALRRARLHDARLYLCVGLRPDLESFLDAVLGEGVDVVQMREKEAGALPQMRAAEVFRRAADRYGALFIVNDRADIAVACGADGVHVGQDDLPPDAARAVVGQDLLVGRSTHDRTQIAASEGEPVDYIGVGPVNATPTKPGRPGVGIDVVREAAARAGRPFFVTGGMDAATIPAVAGAGARGFVVVRAITEAADPAAAVKAIRVAIEA